MPSEQPNENMDKVLKAYAKKRREDSTQIEMDLPTRNMLQAEVKRTLGEVPAPAATRPRPRFAWWPQLIIGVASAAALAIAVLVWKLPSRTETTDSVVAAHNEPAPAAEPATIARNNESKHSAADAALVDKDAVVENGFKAEAPKTYQPPTATPALADHSKASESHPQRQIEIEKNPEVPAPAAVASTASPTPSVPTPAPVQSAPTTPAQQTSTVAPTGAIAAAAPAPQIQARNAAKSLAVNIAAPNAVAPQQEKQRIQFSQINNRTQYRENLNSPPLPKVLTKFGFERTGTNVVVKDADGSVYAGKAFQNVVSQNHVQSFAGGFTQSANSTANATGDTIPDDNFAFRVSGYNRKLRQKITFTGNVINAVQTVSATNGAALQIQSSNAQQQLPAQNILLNGRVQVGRSSEFDIQAAPITK